uniref:Uncharacterized protein n=1 Tax=Cajanus cajan TaxID=3821 RepID=A0A151T558_CAJCA|nr:hypothetical protein KK1_016714 [Cajanus cajan]
MGSDFNAPTVRATVVQASTIFHDTPATLEAFVGGYTRGSAFVVSIRNRAPKGREEFCRYHSTTIDVPGKS